MRTEKEIQERLTEIEKLKEEVAEITRHGYPAILTIYQEALEWVLEKHTTEVRSDDDSTLEKRR